MENNVGGKPTIKKRMTRQPTWEAAGGQM